MEKTNWSDKADPLYVEQHEVQLKRVWSLIIQVPLSELFLPVRVAIVAAGPLRHLLLLGFLKVCGEWKNGEIKFNWLEQLLFVCGSFSFCARHLDWHGKEWKVCSATPAYLDTAFASSYFYLMCSVLRRKKRKYKFLRNSLSVVKLLVVGWCEWESCWEGIVNYRRVHWVVWLSFRENRSEVSREFLVYAAIGLPQLIERLSRQVCASRRGINS